MRIGEWVPVYKRLLPIPQRLSMAFGLHDGSELNVARIADADTRYAHGCELIVSPIPTSSWPSVCRLSVRLSDKSHALAVATEFLRREQINILLSECCSTYQQRAHWDAICDIHLVNEFSTLVDVPRNEYESRMQSVTEILTKKFAEYMHEDDNCGAFLTGGERYVQFSPLTGLNDGVFLCEGERIVVQHRSGAIELPDKLAYEISLQCHMPNSRVLPEYAIITGNTEQRYMRVLFLRDYENMFRAVLDDDIAEFAGGGIGLLHGLLEALPQQINLIHASNHIFARGNNVARGRIMLTGHWSLAPDMAVMPEDARHRYMEDTFRQLIKLLAIDDIEGRKHTAAVNVVHFDWPTTVYPRVFISHSMGRDPERLWSLMTALLHHQFQPVLGTDTGRESQLAGRPVPANVMQGSFETMAECVACISLQLKRDDFKIVDAVTGATRYLMAPWAVAEEVYAWSKNIGMLIRLKDAAVEDPGYNRDIPTKVFRDDQDFPKALEEVLAALDEFRQSARFERVRLNAREAQFPGRISPAPGP